MTTKAAWAEMRKQVHERDEHICQFCRTERDLTVHHILPKSSGGGNELHNLILLCQECHLGTHRAYKSGYACPGTFWQYLQAMRITEDWDGVPDDH